jgi:IS5 family transposase
MPSLEQLEFRPRLPVVVGNADYRQYEERLLRMDELLRQSGLVDDCVERCTAQWLQQLKTQAARAEKCFHEPSAKQLTRYQRLCRQALRCNLARQWIGKEFRTFSLRLAESSLLQWFCQVDRLEQVRVPSKSTLDRYDKLMPEADVRELVDRLNRTAVENAQRLELEQALRMEVVLADTTCIEANIHFPTDWVLLRDAVRTLVKAVKVIRQHGLKYRMPDPDQFLRKMNRLSIEMGQSRRRADSAKHRKVVLRRMKVLSKQVQAHAQRYAERLQADWQEQTDLHEGEMKRIAARIAGVLDLLPEAIRQAHERIIGGRKVENSEKILSLYEPDVHVIVRHKAGAEVEFGNTLLLVEQEAGLIVDWKLCKPSSPGDIALMKESLIRMKQVFGRYPGAVGGDRGFASKPSHRWLESEGISDATCPRDPYELSQRMQNDIIFRDIQKRRAQTEARIGIVKNAFLGTTLRSKGFEHRELTVTWAVLAHNLWLLAVLPKEPALAKAA